jgi:hypothetical protein
MRLRHSPHETPPTASKWLWGCAVIVLAPVALIGGALSFRSQYLAASTTFGTGLALGFPALMDLLILGASLAYMAGAAAGRPMRQWRLLAHAGVGGTLTLNALAAPTWSTVPWHIAAPTVWSVLVELTSQQILGDYEATHHGPTRRIPLSLWVSAPVESARTRLLMARTGQPDAHAARIAVGVHAAAREALRLSLPHRRERRIRSTINRQLRAGSLPPAAILGPLGWATHGPLPGETRVQTIQRQILSGVLDPGTRILLQQQPPPLPSEASAPAATAHLAPHTTEAGDADGTGDGTRSSDAPPEDPAPLKQDRLETRNPMPAPLRPDSPEPEPEPEPDAVESVLPASASERQAEQRLADAVAIVEKRPHITGPELRSELQSKGWTLSRRTATRILRTASTTIARQQPGRALTAVRG